MSSSEENWMLTFAFIGPQWGLVILTSSHGCKTVPSESAPLTSEGPLIGRHVPLRSLIFNVLLSPGPPAHGQLTLPFWGYMGNSDDFCDTCGYSGLFQFYVPTTENLSPKTPGLTLRSVWSTPLQDIPMALHEAHLVLC